MKLETGQKAPEFEVKNEKGELIKLSDYLGKKVVLYFYPKDDTPGCTKEACSFRDADSIYREQGIKVLGVSLDTEQSHQAFASKHSLPFTLLSDTDHSVSDAFGVYGEQTSSSTGNKYMGLARKTFLIDEQGRIKKVFDKVNVESHADEVLAAF